MREKQLGDGRGAEEMRDAGGRGEAQGVTIELEIIHQNGKSSCKAGHGGTVLILDDK